MTTFYGLKYEIILLGGSGPPETARPIILPGIGFTYSNCPAVL